MKEAQMAIPHLFRCPISLDLFTDPVTLCTGQTYDRSSIEKWLAAGNLTCPVTMQKLHDPSIVPNHTLRHLIDQWLQMGPHFHPDYLKIDPDLSLVTLKHSLESHESTLETKFQALKRIQVLTQELPSRNCYLSQLGFFNLLLELVFRKVEDKNFQEYMKLAEQALTCAIKLMPFGELGSLNILKEEARLTSLVSLFDRGNTVIRKNLCQLVEAVSSCLETKELCALLGKTQELLQGMVHLIQQNCEASEAGIKAILALCSLESNWENLVRQRAVGGLIMCIASNEGRARSSAPIVVAVLELLLGLEEAKQDVISNPNGIKALVKMVFRVSDHKGSESAINSLMIICYDSLLVQEEAISAGILTQLLLLLQSQCGARTKAKARMLLKLLRSMGHKV